MPDVRARWTVIQADRAVEPALPWWARAADLVAIALVIVGVTVSASGGFRLRFGDWRFALTSLYRPLLLAALVAGARHLLVRDPPIYLPAFRQAQRWARSAALRTAASVFAGSRPAIVAAGLLAVLMFGYPPGAPPWRDYDNELLNLPLRWDAGWYLQIAENGYSYIPEAGAAAQQNIVFFPACPMVTRVVGLLLGNQKTAYVAAGTVVSLAAFLFALAYLYAFARDEIGDERAPAALWLLAAYPFALFFGAIYTESLYLLAALGAFHHFRRREFVRAGIWGLIIGLTRPNGGLLTLPLALLALSPWLPPAIAGGRPADDQPGARAGLRSGARAFQVSDRMTPALAAAAMCAVGTLLYSTFIWGMTGNPIAWASGHAAWGRHYTSLAHLVATRYTVIGDAGLYQYVARSPYDLLNVLGAAFVLAAVWPVWRRFGIAFAAFILVNMLPPLTTGGFLSAGRLSAVLFPAFVWLAAAVPPRQRTAWIVSFAMLQALCAALFYTWRPLF
jgi:hypothetical protein